MSDTAGLNDAERVREACIAAALEVGKRTAVGVDLEPR